MNFTAEEIAKALGMVCRYPSNPTGWAVLKAVGYTKADLQKAMGDWVGPKPDLSLAPKDFPE